jgi:hypothetical protein
VRLCLRMYVCVHECTFVFTNVRLCLRMYVYVYECTFVFTNVRLCSRMCVCVLVCLLFCMHISRAMCFTDARKQQFVTSGMADHAELQVFTHGLSVRCRDWGRQNRDRERVCALRGTQEHFDAIKAACAALQHTHTHTHTLCTCASQNTCLGQRFSHRNSQKFHLCLTAPLAGKTASARLALAHLAKLDSELLQALRSSAPDSTRLMHHPGVYAVW